MTRTARKHLLPLPDGSRRDAASTDPEPVIATLRRATADRHRAIEAQLRLDGAFTRRRYAAVMHGFAEFLAAWEPRLHAALPMRLQPWFAARRRGALACRDVEALATGERPPPLRPAVALASLRLPTRAAAFGSLYVMEGSALGGRVIARRAAALGYTAQSGAAYFEGHGGATGLHWRDFCAVLEREVGTAPTARADACRAALQTFAALAETFGPIDDGPGHDDHA